MADASHFQIRISGEGPGGRSRNLSMGELGVLLTGINRALNKQVAPVIDYSPQSQEPASVRAEVVQVENGSVLLTVLVSVSDFAQTQILQPTFLAGIFGSAAWDFTKLLSKEVKHALTRVGHDVRKEVERIDPTLDGPARVAVQGGRALPQAATYGLVPETDGATSGPRNSSPRTSYSVSFEQPGSPKITVTYSAIPRKAAG